MTYSDLSCEKVINAQRLFRDLNMQHWLNHELFGWRWWVLVFVTFVPLIIWWKFVDKKRLLEIAVFGLLINMSSTFLDDIGSELVFWDYPIKLFSAVHNLSTVNLVVLPVLFMFIYQNYKGWKQFLIAVTIFSALCSFICEPLLVQFGFYVLYTWKYIYSFPIYILMCALSKFITELFISKQNQFKKA